MMIRFYGVRRLIEHIDGNNTPIKKLIGTFPFSAKRSAWVNIGGQLIPADDFGKFRRNIHSGKIKGWDDVHAFYASQGAAYDQNLFLHAFASLREIDNLKPDSFGEEDLLKYLKEAMKTMEWIHEEIIQSRQKDYENPFRKMIYENDEEMNRVLGSMENNSFINLKKQEGQAFKNTVRRIIRKISV